MDRSVIDVIEILVGLATAGIGVGAWRIGTAWAHIAAAVLVVAGIVAVVHGAASLLGP